MTARTFLVAYGAAFREIVEPWRGWPCPVRDRLFTPVTSSEGGVGSLQRLTGGSDRSALVLSLATIVLTIDLVRVPPRTREVAIRLALGAQRPAVLRCWRDREFVSRGIVLGLALTRSVPRFMRDDLRPVDARPITVAGFLWLSPVETLGACYLPAPCMRIDPMRVRGAMAFGSATSCAIPHIGHCIA